MEESFNKHGDLRNFTLVHNEALWLASREFQVSDIARPPRPLRPRHLE